MVAGEDLMELSMDIERRYLGDDDIDIDLVLDGKSPRSQDDDYMLDDHEEQGTYDGGYVVGKDDEMADDGEAIEEMNNSQEDYTGENHEDMEEFDILVDDEDIQDAEDPGISYDETSNVPSVHLYPSHNLTDTASHTEDLNDYHHIYPDAIQQDLSHSDGGVPTSLEAYAELSVQYSDVLPRSVGESKVTDMIGNILTSQTIHEESAVVLPHEDIGTNHSRDANNLAKDDVVVSPGQKDFIEQSLALEPQNNGLTEGHKVDNPAGTPPNKDTEIPRTAPQTDEYPHESHPSQIEQSTSLGNPSVDIGVVELRSSQTGFALDDTTETDQDDNLDTSKLPHHTTHIHPIIVVYQDSEIYLFPPHEQTEEQSQTYFLGDESYANGTIKELLGACRLILADSISDQEELELKIAPLKLEISETSAASSDASLTQIIDIYLHLQLNDGIESPGPLRMTLTTRFSFLDRLEYLNKAVAAGTGYLAVIQSEDSETTDEFDDENRVYDGALAELTDPGNTGAETYVDDYIPPGNDEAPGVFHHPGADKEHSGTEKVDHSTAGVLDYQTDDEEGNILRNSKQVMSNYPSNLLISEPLEQKGEIDAQVTIHEAVISQDYGPSVDDPNRSHSLQITESLSVDRVHGYDRSAAEVYLPGSSKSSSTLHGDDLENADDVPSEQSTLQVPAYLDDHVEHEGEEMPRTDEHSGWLASDVGESYLTADGGAEASTYNDDIVEPKHVDPDDGEDFFGFHQVDQHDVLSDPDVKEANSLDEGKYEKFETYEESVESVEEIEGALNVGEDEITFEDPKEDTTDESNPAEGNGPYSPSKQDGSGNYSNDFTSSAKRDSVKRARLEEDDDLEETESTPESKRFRSD